MLYLYESKNASTQDALRANPEGIILGYWSKFIGFAPAGGYYSSKIIIGLPLGTQPCGKNTSATTAELAWALLGSDRGRVLSISDKDAAKLGITLTGVTYEMYEHDGRAAYISSGLLRDIEKV